MIQTFRWFGVTDSVQLSHIAQAGATGVVTALHHVQNGEVWKVEEIMKVKTMIEKAGLTWSFIESIPVHENIKLQKGDYLQRIENYKQSIKNVAACGVKNVCYNFMPVLDWTRTQLFWPLKNGATALRFDKVEMAVFEIYLMERKGAEKDYTEAVLKKAKLAFEQMSSTEKIRLSDCILKGLPGTVDDLSMEDFKEMIAQYDGMSHQDLKNNLSFFLNEVIPVAEENGVVMAIHPDDPPMDILGLPRIIKSEKDLEDLVGFVDSPSNGITFCTGSLGANPNNDLPKLIEKFADRIHFLHLRNVRREADGSFFEDEHLGGSSDMYEVVKAVAKIEKQRGIEIPMRPDHGHQIIDDLTNSNAYCGYTALGRLKGLAELRGLELGIKRSLL
ncbi:mannonate dehydratase [Wenyingzhuangia heitensis]|uniref:Mannonate dehydratase n=1 Tax=Wenyingzhuangia heitensis TaxID=1487859 RepID=A0ABX0UBN5_9FLAO|nr:mannonate dehydratase [Wenyingzhuangia heitensis]NIJ46244.1 mannonate dehydratase [Wenyingzhuangia heitensis]